MLCRLEAHRVRLVKRKSLDLRGVSSDSMSRQVASFACIKMWIVAELAKVTTLMIVVKDSQGLTHEDPLGKQYSISRAGVMVSTIGFGKTQSPNATLLVWYSTRADVYHNLVREDAAV